MCETFFKRPKRVSLRVQVIDQSESNDCAMQGQCKSKISRKSREWASKKGQKNALPPGLEPRMTVPKTVVLPITPWENARFDVHGSQYSSRVVHKKL